MPAALTVVLIAALTTRCLSVASSCEVFAAPAIASAPNRACRPFLLPVPTKTNAQSQKSESREFRWDSQNLEPRINYAVELSG